MVTLAPSNACTAATHYASQRNDCANESTVTHAGWTANTEVSAMSHTDTNHSQRLTNCY